MSSTILSPNDIMQVVQQAGFNGYAAVVASAVAYAESGGNIYAQHINSDGSVDRGLFQINNRYHPEVSDSCAYNPLCAAKATYSITNAGSDWSQWVTYTHGIYAQYISIFTDILNNGNISSNNTNTTQNTQSTTTGFTSNDITATARTVFIFIIAIFLIIYGIWLIFGDQIKNTAKTTTKTAMHLI